MKETFSIRIFIAFFKGFFNSYAKACVDAKMNHKLQIIGTFVHQKANQTYVVLRRVGKRAIIKRRLLEVFYDDRLVDELPPRQAAQLGYFSRMEEERDVNHFLLKEKIARNKNADQ